MERNDLTQSWYVVKKEMKIYNVKNRSARGLGWLIIKIAMRTRTGNSAGVQSVIFKSYRNSIRMCMTEWFSTRRTVNFSYYY